MDINLSRYQIFNESAGEWDEGEEPCLIHNLRLCHISESVITHLKANIPGYYCRRTLLPIVAELANVYVSNFIILVHKSCLINLNIVADTLSTEINLNL